MTVTLQDQLRAAQRELAMRRNVYPNQVASRRMSQDKANHEIACMEAIVESIDKLRMLAEVSDEMKAKAACANPKPSQ